MIWSWSKADRASHNHNSKWCLCVIFDFLDNDGLPSYYQNGQRDCHYSSGSQPGRHNRTFYRRRMQQPLPVASTFDADYQQTPPRDYSGENRETGCYGTWLDRHGRVHTYKVHNQRQQNGYRRVEDTRGNRPHGNCTSRQHAQKTIDDLDDFEDDPWPSVSTESTSVSVSSTSLKSPRTPSGWCPSLGMLKWSSFF